MSAFLAGLNDAQRRAVDHHSGPLLVVAGAGSGKTRALTHRIAHLISHHGVDPADLLAVTFTNKAAREMKERLELLLAQRLAQSQFGQPWSTLPPIEQRQLRSRIYREVIKDLWIGTFHALFARLLQRWRLALQAIETHYDRLQAGEPPLHQPSLLGLRWRRWRARLQRLRPAGRP